MTKSSPGRKARIRARKAINPASVRNLQIELMMCKAKLRKLEAADGSNVPTEQE